MQWVLRRKAIWVVLLLVTLWALEMGGAHWWPVGALICLPHLPLFLPLLGWSARRPGGREGGCLVMAWLAALVLSGFQLHGPGAAGNLRVMSYNVRDHGPHPEWVERFGVQLCALQELAASTDWQPWPGWQVARQGEFVLLSRYPILRSWQVELQPDRFSRPAQVVELQLPTRRLRVVNVHLSNLLQGPGWIREHAGELPTRVPQAMRDRQAQVHRLLQEVSGGSLVMGDFNGQPRDAGLRAMRDGLGEAFEERGNGWGSTFSATWPLLRIDYLWHTRDIHCQGCWVGNPSEEGPDHRPLLADFRV